jgi:16S rRNA (adenine1518-N6/adenine1519-N6)-dimethyltransferase
MKSAVVLLKERGLRAKKALGQNFLLDANISERIAAAATPSRGGSVLEIGPGLGALTRPLLARAERVVAIERDHDLEAILREELSADLESGRLALLRADALAVDWRDELRASPAPRAVAGNLPYLITGRLIERAIEVADVIERAVFMVQAEVADRLVAKPGAEAYGALGVFTQAAFASEKLLTVKGGAFHPRPEVDSSVVVLTPHRPPRAIEDDAFRTLVKAAFGARRKTLRNAWRNAFGWSNEELAAHAEAAGIDLQRRGETLSVEEFDRVAQRAR